MSMEVFASFIWVVTAVVVILLDVRLRNIKRFEKEAELKAFMYAPIHNMVLGKRPLPDFRALHMQHFFRALPPAQKMLFSFRKLTLENWFSENDRRELFGTELVEDRNGNKIIVKYRKIGN